MVSQICRKCALQAASLDWLNVRQFFVELCQFDQMLDMSNKCGTLPIGASIKSLLLKQHAFEIISSKNSHLEWWTIGLHHFLERRKQIMKNTRVTMISLSHCTYRNNIGKVP